MQTEVNFARVNSFVYNVTQRKSHGLALRKTLYRDNWFYNYPLHNVGLKITSYEVGTADYILETQTDQLYVGNYNIEFF